MPLSAHKGHWYKSGEMRYNQSERDNSVCWSDYLMNFGQPEEEVTMEKLLAAERELDTAEMDRQVAGEVNQDPNSYL